ncbi:hypothetical protein [Frondihabitans sp. VKM Ac-2883]|nr:hypothetical protein [Frondihabitans sp. VKM Ac-2883]
MPLGASGPDRGLARSSPVGVVVLDIVYIAVVIAVFAVVALVARGVEKL